MNDGHRPQWGPEPQGEAAYGDPRLVDLYDQDNPDGPDHDLYRALADELGAQSILDLGCGTGLLTVTFARPGRVVVGLDPSPAMLDIARRRPGADQVRWIPGDSSAWATGGQEYPRFDYAVMTGNVAQHILDPDWQRTLTDLAAAVRPGGVLAFESRNPRARAWESWGGGAQTVRETVHGPLREWAETTEPASGLVQMRFHNVFEATNDYVLAELTLAFRGQDVIKQQLQEAGFVVEEVWGDWARTPVAADSPIMVFHARRG